MQTNLCVYYLYRDVDNYKRHSQRIFSNSTGVTPAQLLACFVKGFLSIQLFPDVVSIDPARLG